MRFICVWFIKLEMTGADGWGSFHLLDKRDKTAFRAIAHDNKKSVAWQVGDGTVACIRMA